MATGTRSYQFTITFDVEAGHPAYDDPEWAADAASGALTNEHGLMAIHTGFQGQSMDVRVGKDLHLAVE